MTNVDQNIEEVTPTPIQEIVLLIHGIRTQASWAEMVSNVLASKAHVMVQPIRYGFFDAARFYFPFFTREAPINRVIRELHDVRFRYPNSKISIIAHSFGTYAITKALREPDIVLHRVILCGSVVPEDFRTATYRAQLGDEPILNDCGTHDIWPVLAKTMTWGYGATGTFGFGTTGIRDRFNKFTHSDYFTKEFVEDYWAPFIRDGTIKSTAWEVDRKAPPYWQSFLAWVPFRWLIVSAPLLVYGSVASVQNYSQAPYLDLEKRLFIGHWTGVTTMATRIYFHNPTTKPATFSAIRYTLESPKGKYISLNNEGIFLGQSMQPPIPEIRVGARDNITFEYSFIADTSELLPFHRAVYNSIIGGGTKAQNWMQLQNWDPNRTIIDGELLERLTTQANRNFSWTAGRWKLNVSYLVDNKSYRNVFYFAVGDDDIKLMRSDFPYFGSGLGVIPIWRNYGPDGKIRMAEVVIIDGENNAAMTNVKQ